MHQWSVHVQLNIFSLKIKGWIALAKLDWFGSFIKRVMVENFCCNLCQTSMFTMTVTTKLCSSFSFPFGNLEIQLCESWTKVGPENDEGGNDGRMQCEKLPALMYPSDFWHSVASRWSYQHFLIAWQNINLSEDGRFPVEIKELHRLFFGMQYLTSFVFTQQNIHGQYLRC